MKNKLAPLSCVALIVVGTGAGIYAQDALPKGEAVLDKYVEATGGKAAYAKVHNSITKVTIQSIIAAKHLNVMFLEQFLAPKSSRSHRYSQGLCFISTGYDAPIIIAQHNHKFI